MGVHACNRAGVTLGSKVLICGAGKNIGNIYLNTLSYEPRHEISNNLTFRQV